MEWIQFFFAFALHIPPTGSGWTDPNDTPGWFWDSIGDAINSAISGLLSALFAPLNLIGSALDHIGDGIMSIGQRIWSYFSQPLTDIWNAIKSLPSLIVSGISDMLLYLFVPSEDYFSTNFNDIKLNFIDKLGVNTSDLDDFKNASGVDLDSISEFSGTLYGQQVKFVDFSFLDQFKSKFHDLARGFIYPFLLLYNMNQVYFMIRGVNLFGNSKGDG